MVAIAVPAQPGAAVLGSLSPAAIEGGNHKLAHVRGAIGGSMSPAANGGNQTFVHLGKKEERERRLKRNGVMRRKEEGVKYEEPEGEDEETYIYI